MTARFAGVVIVAAGRGERFGDSGKVLSTAAGRPLLAWSLDAVARARTVREVVVVCGAHTREPIERLIAVGAGRLPIRVCEGGAERQDSVRAGLGVLSDAVEVAVVHDAARPLATPAMVDDVAAAARDHGAAIVAIPVSDTIKEVEGDRIVRTLPRERLRAAQTPQAFQRDLLAEAMARADVAGMTFTDEGGLLEWAGYPVLVRPGSPSNLKVTVPEDLIVIEALLRARSGDGDPHVSS
jgi:2-C-methyl-D-erythritol 4-phosphate cytidylyltransferase